MPSSNVTHHILDLRKCDLQCDIQDCVRIFYWTQGIGIIFKKVTEQFLSIFSICCFYSCSKKGPGSSFQNTNITGIEMGGGSISARDEFFFWPVLPTPIIMSQKEVWTCLCSHCVHKPLSCLSDPTPSPTKEKVLEGPIWSMELSPLSTEAAKYTQQKEM